MMEKARCTPRMDISLKIKQLVEKRKMINGDVDYENDPRDIESIEKLQDPYPLLRKWKAVRRFSARFSRCEQAPWLNGAKFPAKPLPEKAEG